MHYTATAKYVRTSPRKARLIARAVSGMDAVKAVFVLMQTPKLAAEPVIKVIQSALSNAKSKHAQESALMIRNIDVMEGPAMKRWHAVSRGMAHGYKKRMSHIHVVLTDKNAAPARESVKEEKP